MATDEYMRVQVEHALGFDVDEYDVPAIIDDIQHEFGTMNIDTIPADRFWGIVANHVKGESA